VQTKTYTTIDRIALKWPAGPWDGEPDKMQWPDAATGLPCLAVRHARSGYWCGYVGVAEGHPLYGKDGDDDAVCLDVHWGITFTDACAPGAAEDRGICHIPEPGEPDHVWWFGFDCAHCDDTSPQDAFYEATRSEWFWRTDGTYKTLDFVRSECARLAQQLAEATTER